MGSWVPSRWMRRRCHRPLNLRGGHNDNYSFRWRSLCLTCFRPASTSDTSLEKVNCMIFFLSYFLYYNIWITHQRFIEWYYDLHSLLEWYFNGMSSNTKLVTRKQIFAKSPLVFLLQRRNVCFNKKRFHLWMFFYLMTFQKLPQLYLLWGMLQTQITLSF